MSLSFAFDPSKGETPETLRKKRAIVEAIAAQGMGRAPKTIGDGIAMLGSALSARLGYNALAKKEREGREAGSQAFSSLFGGDFPEAPPMPEGEGTPQNYADQRVSEAHGDFSTKAPEVITRLSADLGISPEQAAGIVGQLGHESEGLKAINERNPLVPGSRGGFGWAQWTGPRRRQFEEWAQSQGLDPSDDEANYGFLLHELKNTPEGAVLDDIRQAPDAQTAGRVFTDKFLRPGIPGYESRSQWTERALMAYQAAREGGATPEQAAQVADAQQAQEGVQVASLDPSIGMQGLPAPMEGEEEMAGIFIGTPEEMAAERQGRPQSPLMAPEAMTGGSPLPLQPTGAQGHAAPAQRVAQAMMGTQGHDPGLTMGAQPVQRGQQPSMQQLMEALENPWISDGQRSVIQALLQQQMQSQDPMRQLEMERAQLELERLRNPASEYDFIEMPDGTVLRANPATGVLEPAFQGQPKTPDLPSAVREYEYAREQGFPGTFQDWEASKKGGMSLSVDSDGNIQFSQGGVAPDGRDGGTLGKELSKADVSMLKDAREQAASSENLSSLANQLEQVIGNVGYTGPGGDLYGAVDDVVKVLPGEEGARGALRSLGMEAQLTFTEKTKGAITDREMGMFRQAVPNLAQTPEGNQEIIKIIRAGANRVLARSDFLEQFLAKNGSLQGAQAAWNRFMEQNPMIAREGNQFVVSRPADFTPYLDPSFAGEPNQNRPGGRKSVVIDGYTIEEVE